MAQYEIEEIHDGEYAKVLKYVNEESTNKTICFIVPGLQNTNTSEHYLMFFCF